MIAIALLVLGAAQSSVPVWSGSLPPPNSVHGNLCNLAVVSGLRSSRLQVRSGPGMRFQRIDALGEGARVYTCNGSGEWLGVAYGRPGMTCGSRENVGLDIAQTLTCRSGWVHRRWIEIITG